MQRQLAQGASAGWAGLASVVLDITVSLGMGAHFPVAVDNIFHKKQ